MRLWSNVKIKMKRSKKKSTVNYYFTDYANVKENYLSIVKCYIEYYHRRARNCKRQYYICNMLKYLALAIIPVTQVIDSTKNLPWIAAVSSSLCIVIESILKLWRTQEKWILYRTTYNMLMSEQRQYIALGEEYKFDMFVQRVEALIDNEAYKWVSTHEKDKKET